MLTSLAAFQDAFAQALMATPETGAAAPVDALAAQPGFAVYRNTVIKGCIDALQANYPAVVRLTGAEWFRAAAAVYVRTTPPDDPVLMRYGASFAAFLARFEPAKALSYLPGVARLDHMWTESHMARDDTLLASDAISCLAPASIANVVVYPHAATRCAWFPAAPIFSIWARNRSTAATADEAWSPHWHGEGALLTRPHDKVEWMVLNEAEHAFVETCANGGTLGQAAAVALAVDADVDLQHWMAKLLSAGAFSRMSIVRGRTS